MYTTISELNKKEALSLLSITLDGRLDTYSKVVDVYLMHLPTTPVTLYLLCLQQGILLLESAEWAQRYVSYYSYREQEPIPVSFVLTDSEYALFDKYASTRVGV